LRIAEVDVHFRVQREAFVLRHLQAAIPGQRAPQSCGQLPNVFAERGGTLYGAAAGAILVNYAKTYFTSTMPEAWYYALGTLFVLVTLFLPRGITGLLSGGGIKKQLETERLRVQEKSPEGSQE
jgi:hypothetical protein